MAKTQVTKAHCIECGRELKNFMHTCPQSSTAQETYGCPFCDDKCPLCIDKQDED